MNKEDFGIEAMKIGGSVCKRRVEGGVFIKYSPKNVDGINNGYSKLFYETIHMKKTNKLIENLYPKVLFVNEDKYNFEVGLELLFNGTTLADILRSNTAEFDYFSNSLKFILDSLFKKMYSIRKTNITPNNDYIEYCYLSRIVSRLETSLNLLDNLNFSNRLIKLIKNGAFINDEFYPSPFKYIEYIRNSPHLLEKLQIKHNTESHHDMIAGNILVQLGENMITDFRLIDPRGEDETSLNNRNCMYDIGKLLFGVDSYDIIRIFNGKIKEKLYYYECLESSNPNILNCTFKFNTDNFITNKYIRAEQFIWDYFETNNYFNDILDEDNLKLKFLFSKASMHLSDIPCRIIDEADEEMFICFYLRGMQLLREFMNFAFGSDPLATNNVNTHKESTKLVIAHD